MRIRLRLALAGIIFGILIIVADMRDVIWITKKPVGFYELEPSQITSGIYVKDEILLIMDQLGTEVTIENNVERESAREYVIPLLAEDGDMIYIDQIMAIEVRNDEDYRVIERVMDDTVDWWFDETDTVEIGKNTYNFIGVVQKMNKDEKDLMISYAMEVFGDNRAQAEKRVIPYVLQPLTRSRVFGILALGIVIFAVGVALMAWEISSRRRF